MTREQVNKGNSIVDDIKITESLLSLLSNKGFLELAEEAFVKPSLKLEGGKYHMSVYPSEKFLLKFKEFLFEYKKELETELEEL